MRAWLLLLAVLATFQTIVQVASTEDSSSSTGALTATTTTSTAQFIAAISPLRRQQQPQQTADKSTTALTRAFNPVIDIKSKAETAIESSSSTSTSTSSSSSSSAAASAATVKYENRDSDSDSMHIIENNQNSNIHINNNNNINKNIHSDNSDNSVIIEIKNIEEIDGNDIDTTRHNQKYQQHQQRSASERLVHETKSRTEQLQSEFAEEHNNNNIINNSNQSNNKLTEMSIKDHTDDEETRRTESVEESQQHHSNHHKQHIQHHSHHSENPSHHPHHHHHHHHHGHSHNQHHHQPHQPHHHHNQSPEIRESSTEISSIITTTATTPAAASSEATPVVQHTPDGDIVEVEQTQPQDAVLQDDNDATFSNKEIISEKVKPDPKVLVEIENSLLSLFNMKRPPKIDRSKIIIPEAMKDLYKQIMGHEFDSVNIPKKGLLTKSANTVRSFTHKDSKIDDRFPHHHRFRLNFDVKSIPAEEKLKAAELQLTREAISHAALHPSLANRTRYHILVYDIIRVGIKGKREPSYLLLDNKTIRVNSTETVSLDVQPAVDRWLATPKKNYGLLIEVRTTRTLKPAPHHHVRLRRSADEPHDTWLHKQPLLFTYTDDGRHKSRSIRDVSNRSKRAGHRRPHRRKNHEENCRRHALYVDFEDVGWSDWIVAPPGYDAFYCHGKCPFPLAEHLNSTNHAVVQTLVNNINPGKVPKACCVPTQLEGISMLYLNDQRTVVLKNYQDMTVVGCGCR